MGVTLTQTPPTDIPGVIFGVTAAVFSNIDGSTSVGAPVSIRLEPSGDGTATCSGAPTCIVSSGNGSLAACQMRLPCVGTFNLTACTAKGVDQACTTVIIMLKDLFIFRASFILKHCALTTSLPAGCPGQKRNVLGRLSPQRPPILLHCHLQLIVIFQAGGHRLDRVSESQGQCFSFSDLGQCVDSVEQIIDPGN